MEMCASSDSTKGEGEGHRFRTLGPEDTNFSLLSLNLDKSFKVFKFHLSHFVK